MGWVIRASDEVLAARFKGQSMDDVQWQALADAAKAACANAYSRYSGFSVGAAVLTDRGVIAKGCNVENASFGLTSCA